MGMLQEDERVEGAGGWIGELRLDQRVLGVPCGLVQKGWGSGRGAEGQKILFLRVLEWRE